MYQWDEGNIAHLAKHNVSPAEAEQVINNHPLDLERQIRGNEQRMPQLGKTDAGHILVVVTTMREDLIRVVTAFPQTSACGCSTRRRKVPRMPSPKKLETPEFRDEAHEAQWWADNQSLLLGEFQQAARDGTLGEGTLAKRTQTPTTTIRLDPTDVALAREQAAERGLRYQTYLKMLLHQALVLEKANSSRSTSR